MIDERDIAYVTCDRCGGPLGEHPGTLGWSDDTTETTLQICTECRAEIDEFVKPSPVIEAVCRPLVDRDGHQLAVAMYTTATPPSLMSADHPHPSFGSTSAPRGHWWPTCWRQYAAGDGRGRIDM